jgi:hypothetical protein
MSVESSIPSTCNLQVNVNNKKRCFDNSNDDSSASTQSVTTITNNYDCTQYAADIDPKHLTEIIKIMDIKLFSLNKKYKRAIDQVDILQHMHSLMVNQMDIIQTEHNRMLTWMVLLPKSKEVSPLYVMNHDLINEMRSLESNDHFNEYLI